MQDLRDRARLVGRVLAPLPARARVRAQDPAEVQVRPLQRLLRLQGGRNHLNCAQSVSLVLLNFGQNFGAPYCAVF